VDWGDKGVGGCVEAVMWEVVGGEGGSEEEEKGVGQINFKGGGRIVEKGRRDKKKRGPEKKKKKGEKKAMDTPPPNLDQTQAEKRNSRVDCEL